jgi:3-oxoacyl-[acyl-carrier protein] reductase
MKVALVTGTAQGVGQAIAGRLHDDGFVVVMADIARERNRASAVALDPDGARTQVVDVDLRDPDAAVAVVEQAIGRWGRLDVLVNNAAVAKGTPLWDVDVAEWDDVMATNLRSTFLLSRAAGAHMRERGDGRIINMASLSAQAARPSGVHYSASKAGIVALTRVFAQELAADGVTVNAIAPGVTNTPMVQAVSAPVLEGLVAAIPVGRICAPEEIAALAAFLASEHAGFITGATYDINGGVLMR